MKKIMMAVLVVGLTATVAQAAPMTTLDIVSPSPGNWEVYADVSLDNAGLMMFDLDVTGSGGLTVDSSLNESPSGAVMRLSPTEVLSLGFYLQRSGGVNGQGIFGAQQTSYGNEYEAVLDALVIRGVGQTSGTFTPPAGTVEILSPSWSHPVLLASGTYTGTVGTLTAAEGEASWAVLTITGSWEGPGNVEGSDVSGDSIFIPEPATMLVLLGGALVGSLIRRRRR